MRTFNLYFYFIIVFIGTAGIWLPLIASGLNGNIEWGAIPINITSYFIVLLITSCTDKGLELIDGKMPKRDFLTIIMILIISLIYVFIIGIAASKNSILAWILSIIGFLFSLYYWYNNSKDIPKYSDSSSPLGGSSNQFN